MIPNYTPLAVKNSGFQLERLVPDALTQPPVVENYAWISRLYRRLAVGLLLCSGEPEGFYTYLFDSSRAFLHFVKTAPFEEQVTSQADAFLDAIACRDEDGARAIAQASRRTLNTGREYEEDFLYLSLMMKFAYLDVPKTELKSMLDEWQRYADENPDDRIDVCRALIERDQALFDNAITAAIESRITRWDAKRAEDLLDPDEAATLCLVSPEVLAWIELAERTGLNIETEYRLAPSTARQFHLIAFPPTDHWKHPIGFSSLEG